MEDMGYERLHESVQNTMEFSLPHRRLRWYSVYRDGASRRPAVTAVNAAAFATTLQRFKCSPLPLAQFLVDAQPERRFHTATPLNGRWRRVHEAFMRKHGLSPTSVEALVESPSFCSGVQSARVRHLLACWHESCAARGVDLAHADVILQVDQALDRMPTSPLGGDAFLPCATAQSAYWYAPRQGFLSSTEVLSLQGLSPEEQERYGLGRLSQALRRDLAGNCFSLPVATAMWAAAIMST